MLNSFAPNRTASEVMQLISLAISQSTRQWVPGRGTDAAAILQARKDFDSSLIHPVIDSIDVEPHIAGVLQVEPGGHPVWFITGPAAQRVFLDDHSGLFGVAWGPDAVTGRYVDLGIRTDDPIDAFLA